MIVLLGISFVAGIVTAFTPCILPVLPIVLAGGASGGRRKPYAIVAGLVASFTVFTLAATWLLDLLHLRQDLLRDIAIGMLFVLAATLLVPRLADLLERPFLFLTRRRAGDLGGGFLLGTSLGLVFVPCAGPAPAFTGISTWLNTPGGRPLSLAGLRGKVVLVDFWTYSCINCLRTLPHLEAWDRAYRKAGLVIVGVHTPEFAFEHVVSNVRGAAHRLGVRYPIAIDNRYGTWEAYGNQYWPAEYLIDRSGHVRHAHFGEGEYDRTESLIRELLATRNVRLAKATRARDTTPTDVITPES